MGKITPFLWLERGADEAAELYVKTFKNSKIIEVKRWGAAGPAPEGSVMTVTFEVDGQRIVAFNGGPHYKLNSAFSLFVTCDTQEEIDAYWSALTANGGAPIACGWLCDRFGVSWQIIPSKLVAWMTDPNPKKAAQVTAAMMQMEKLDIAALRAAYDRA